MNKKALLPGVFSPLIVGSITLTQTLGRPSMENARNVDVISLFAAGMCFGVALVALIAILRRKF